MSAHRRRCDDGGGAPSTGEHGDLAENVARAETANHLPVLDDVGRSGRDREHRVAEVSFLGEASLPFDVELGAHAGDLLSLDCAHAGKERNRGEGDCVHGATLAPWR